MPSVTTLQDLKHAAIIRVASEELGPRLQATLAPLKGERFKLSVYFGRNMARLYCVDPDAQRCQIDQSKLAQYKRDLDGVLPIDEMDRGLNRHLGDLLAIGIEVFCEQGNNLSPRSGILYWRKRTAALVG